MNSIMRILLVCLGWLLFGLWVPSALAATLTIAPNTAQQSLDDIMDGCSEPAGQGLSDQIAEIGCRFDPLSPPLLRKGFDSRTHWLRFSLHNPEPRPVTRWLSIGHPRLQSVTLFQQNADQSLEWQSKTGTLVPPVLRPAPMLVTTILPVELDAGETRQLVLRVQSLTSIELHTSLWEPMAFLQWQSHWVWLHGLGLGGLLLASFVGFVVFAYLKERLYLYLALATLSDALLESSLIGFMQTYLWPADAAFHTGFLLLGSGGMLLFMMQFVRSFLNLKAFYPRLDKSMATLIYISLAAIVLSLATHNQNGFKIYMVALLGLELLTFGIAIHLWRQGFAPAKILFFCFAAELVSECLRMSAVLGWRGTSPELMVITPWVLVLSTPLILAAVTAHTASLRERLRHAGESSRIKTEFLARISHELRTPLNAIIGYARMLSRKSRRLTVEEGAQTIERSGVHLLGMIDEILDFSRGEAGLQKLYPEAVRLSDFFNDIRRSMDVMVHQSGNSFRLSLDDTLPERVLFDPQRLRQVIDNLLVNANRYTQHGLIQLHCVAEVKDTAPSGQPRYCLTFRIKDSGCGIARENFERIFEPFVRASDQPLEHGLRSVGLGLAIARQLTQLMGGDLWLESSQQSGPLAGSCFVGSIVCEGLPEGRGVEVAPVALTNAPNRYQLLHYAGRTRLVLVVEDDSHSRRMMVDLLDEAGFEVWEAASGEQALMQLSAGIDLVLTDQFMPYGDGWSVLKGVREKYPEMPVVLLSAADAQKNSQAIEARIAFNAVLRKPVDIARLERVLGDLLGVEWLPEGVDSGAPEVREEVSPAELEHSAHTIPLEKRQVLAELVAQGCVTDIEAWADALRQENPAFGWYADSVQQAVQVLDFPRLRELTDI